MQNIFPKLSLVGAGPGDPDLLTIKAVKALESADVILYDALVTEAILDFANTSAIKVFVGKRAGKHSFKQEEINQLIVDYAQSHGHVVRLKGGDPFIFGRGHEELVFARENSIQIEVIPGISSSVGLTALQQVPLTRRGINESFWVLTGTTRNAELSEDISLAVRSSATVVILMGIGKLAQIAEKFIVGGKKDTPVLVVQNGSRPDEKFVVGTIEDIVEKVLDAGIGTPGIIVIGDVVALHPEYTLQHAFAQLKEVS